MRGGRGGPWAVGLAMVAIVAGVGADQPRREPTPAPASPVIPPDDLTFRPTVLIRKGKAQGSGTVIASIKGETLILTAAHVVAEPGPLRIELHRYNVGLERAKESQGWPLSVPGEIAAAEPSADVAVVRVRSLVALPHVARIAPGEGELAKGTVVTSVGIDGGAHLSSWAARVVGIVWFEEEGGKAERPFLLTSRAPEPGRSGGGLFLANGDLVGVCMGRTKVLQGHRTGVFVSPTSIRQVLRDHKLDVAIDQTRTRNQTLPALRAPITTTGARPPR